MVITLVHGFNVRDRGAGSIDKLKPYLEQIGDDVVVDTDTADYGWQFLLRVNWFYWIGGTIKRIASALSDADVVITHSNGANYCMKALKKINKPNLKIIHLSPALNRKHKFKEVFHSCHVMHSRKDSTVSKARLMPLSSWGDMGNVGAKTTDMRVINVDQTKRINGHSDWFSDHNIDHVVSLINKIINFN